MLNTLSNGGLTLVRGEHGSTTIRITKDGVKRELQDGETLKVELKVKAGKDEPVVKEWTLENDGLFVLNHADTADLSLPEYVFRVKLYDKDGEFLALTKALPFKLEDD